MRILLTNDDGVMVGNGPAVSVGETLQLPLPDPVSLPEVESSFLHASIINGTEVAPIRKCFRNFFLECSIHYFF